MPKETEKLRGARAVAVALAVLAAACSPPSTPEAAKDAIMRGIGLRSSSPPLKPEDIPPTEAAAAPPVAPRPARRAPRPAPAPVSAPEPVAVAPPPVEVKESAATTPVVYAPPVIVDHSLYTAADLNVARPTLRASQPPWQWPRDVSRTDTLEVVVSQQGEVERVKLISQPRRMVDMMALSAIKMWKFEPAVKDGAPVRYRLVLRPGAAAY